MGKIVGLADGVVRAAASGRDPAIDIPARTLSNVRYNKASGSSRWAATPTAGSCSTSRQAKSYMQTMLVASGCKTTDRPGQDDQHPRSVLPAQAHHRRHQGGDLRRPGRVRPGDRGLEVLLNSLREELHLYAQNAGRHGRRDHAGRQRRRDRLHADGLRRLRHPLDRRAGGDPVQASARRSSSCTSKRTRSGSGSTRTSSGASTSASSPTAAASRRAACAGCCTACTTS